jgi:molybdenum cofactor cytidylyltransferase
MTQPDELAGLVLAAGESARLGTPKQLAEFRGRPLVAHAVDHALALCDAGVVLVTGAHASGVEAAVAGRPLTVVHNPDWKRGIGSSLRAGMRAIAAKNPGGVLIQVCDQPLIDRDDLIALRALWTHDPQTSAATRYPDGAGVPAIFPATMFAALAACADSAGARELLADLPPERLAGVRGAEADIDTPDDLRRLLQNDGSERSERNHEDD